MLFVLLYFIFIVGANEFPPEDEDSYNSNIESSDETSEKDRRRHINSNGLEFV
jgi:hypothetical protein